MEKDLDSLSPANYAKTLAKMAAEKTEEKVEEPKKTIVEKVLGIK